MTKRVVSILERPVYGASEAAGLVGLRPERARAWLDGYQRRGVDYAPMIRVEPTGADIVTWGEFAELGNLREYRRKGVPRQRLRPVIDELRSEFATPYPVAAKPRHLRQGARPRGPLVPGRAAGVGPVVVGLQSSFQGPLRQHRFD